MSSALKVVQIADGSLTTVQPMSASLLQVARDAYVGVRAGGDDPSQSRVEELISFCLDIVRRAIDGDKSIPPMFFDDDSEVEMLNDYVCRRNDQGFLFSDSISQGQELEPSQLLAAYALHKADAAAHAVLSGDPTSAIESLALACQATADYAFHYGFNDYPGMIQANGWMNAQRSTRLVGGAATKNYVVTRWHEARAIRDWSQLGFAKQIKADVINFAKEQGWTMVDDNAVRTIRDWIAAEVKKNRAG